MNLKGTRSISLKNLNIFTICASMIIFILMWWGAVLIPISIPYGGTFKRIGLTILLILLTKHFDKDLKIKLSEMYRNFDFKNFVYSLIGISVYIYSVKCLRYQKICSFDFSDRDLEGYISLFFFALIHLQTYITILHYSFLQTLEGCISVFFIGTFFTLIFRKTKSIWNAMTIHFFWDYIIELIVK